MWDRSLSAVHPDHTSNEGGSMSHLQLSVYLRRNQSTPNYAQKRIPS